jgi:hypothetical protein
LYRAQHEHIGCHFPPFSPPEISYNYLYINNKNIATNLLFYI